MVWVVWLSLRWAKEQARPIRLENFRIGQSLSNRIGRPIRIRIESRSFAGPNRAATLLSHCPSTATLPAWRIARLPDETDAKKILTASPWRTGEDHQDALTPRGWRLVSSRIWNNLTRWLPRTYIYVVQAYCACASDAYIRPSIEASRG